MEKRSGGVVGGNIEKSWFDTRVASPAFDNHNDIVLVDADIGLLRAVGLSIRTERPRHDYAPRFKGISGFR